MKTHFMVETVEADDSCITFKSRDRKDGDKKQF